MSRFASGKNAFGISDRSGFRYRLRDMRKEWNGLLVGKDEWEAKHPQLDPRRNITDAQAIKDARPARTEPSAEVLLKKDAFLTGGSGSAVITVTEPGHGRTTGDTVRFRKTYGFDGFTQATLQSGSGYEITVTSSDQYTFTVSGETATAGNQRGGGENATVGPVTLEA